MSSHSWPELPERARKAMEAHLGVVAGFESATTGRHSRLSGTLTLADGRAVFCKGTTEDDPNILPTFLEWERHAIAAVDGDCLSHTDLHSLNILVDPVGARIVDWAWSRRAASWVDPAFLVLRLIEKGNAVEQAERWAASIPQW